MMNPNPNPVPPPSPMTIQQFIDLGKVPDFVKEIKIFKGDPTRLIDWITDVDSIFRTYRDNGATPSQINILERSVRRKIDGEAADILNANNISFSWTDIKNTLILYYRDRRDVKTLDFQLTSIRKSAEESLSSYYSRVNELLSLIIAQIQTDDKLRPNAAAHIDYFRDKSLDAFIRGLDKPLSILLKSTNPRTLGQAYNFCTEYYNLDIRSAPFRNEHGSQSLPKPKEPPKIPSRTQFLNPKILLPPPLPPRRPSVPQNYALPPRVPLQTNPFRNQPSQNTFSYNPFSQNPFRSPQISQKVEPMEVDQSQQSKFINYGNRPPMNLKRPASQQYHQNIKRQAHPLENAYPVYDYYDNYDNYNQYAYQYDQSYYNECYPDYPIPYPMQDGSYDEAPPVDNFEIGEASGTSPPKQNAAEPPEQQANFLEWLPRW